MAPNLSGSAIGISKKQIQTVVNLPAFVDELFPQGCPERSEKEPGTALKCPLLRMACDPDLGQRVNRNL
jgi:hypothetical protein